MDELWSAQHGWSPYQYAMNNPVMYSDPSGYYIEFQFYGDNKDYYDQILNDWSEMTGTTFSVGKDGIVSISGGDLTNPILTALMGYSASESGYKFQMEDRLGSAYDPQSDMIFIDSDQTSRFIEQLTDSGIGINPKTLGFGMVALHEMLHKSDLSLIDDPSQYPPIGRTVAIMNGYRGYLGNDYGQRLDYTRQNGRNVIMSIFGKEPRNYPFTTFEYSRNKTYIDLRSD